MNDDALNALARQHAPHVLAEAVREARFRARAELTDLLAKAIVEHATSAQEVREGVRGSNRPQDLAERDERQAVPKAEVPEQASSKQRAPDAQRTQDRPVESPTTLPVRSGESATLPERGLCAYAITRDGAVDLDPISGPEEALGLRLVTHGGLGLVVAEVELARFTELNVDQQQGPHEWTEDDPLVVLARQHDAVVRAVFEQEPVLPLRFATVLSDEDAAQRLLRARHEQARSWLDRVENHCEWGVRVLLVQDDQDSSPPEPDADQLSQLSGTEYLARRRERRAAIQGTRERGAAAARSLHDALLHHASDSTSRSRANNVLLDAAYLVAADRESAFHTEVERLGEDLDRDGATARTTGPWPPYSFTEIELDAGDGRIEVGAGA